MKQLRVYYMTKGKTFYAAFVSILYTIFMHALGIK